MIPSQVLADAYTYSARVDSWLGSRWLGTIPVGLGSVSWTTGQQVQGSVSVTVPRVGAPVEGQDQVDYTPRGPESIIESCGQVLHVSVEVRSVVTGKSFTERLGRFLITSWDVAGKSITVQGKSILHRIEEDRLTSPTTPRAGGTLFSEARRLAGGIAGVLAPGMRDRACPSMSWGESRIDALFEIADAWPARLREGRDGVIRYLPIQPAVSSAPSRVLTDGEGGTVVGVKSSGTRSKVYNRVVARGQQQNDAGIPTFQAVADQTSGPYAVSGPYGVVTKFFSSPLITSADGARASARTMLASSVQRATSIPVTMAPDPTIELDEPVAIIFHDVDGTQVEERWGRVSSLDIPMSSSGTMQVDVEVSQ